MCLAILCILHVYWFMLFVRILMKLLKGGKAAQNAGATEYEGASDASDNEQKKD